MSYLVIGKGSIGTRHADNLATLGADVTHLGWRETNIDTSDLKGFSGLIIATSTDIRVPLIAKAANANLPLYIEKPLAFRATDVAEIYEVARPVADRSVLGLMMRYHPAVREVHARKLAPYAFSFEIGHDVRQWRQNWNFAESYASKPEGGGVLLDLCHELDLAACLVPGVTLGKVDCIGHEDFNGVDFATRIGLSGAASVGTVAMDYLDPTGHRRFSLKSRDQVIDVDVLNLTGSHWVDGKVNPLSYTFDRNDMFLDLMRDFMALAEGRAPSDNPLLPRLDTVRASADLVATAWESRVFHGNLTGGF